MADITVTVITEAAKFISRYFTSTVIEGIALDSDKQPLSEVQVFLGELEDTTSKDGGFIFEGVEAGTHRFSLNYDGQLVENLKKIRVEKGDKVKIRIEIPRREKQLIVLGILSNSKNEPVENATVHIGDALGKTAKDGSFVVFVKNVGLQEVALTYKEQTIRNVKNLYIEKLEGKLPIELQLPKVLQEPALSSQIDKGHHYPSENLENLKAVESEPAKPEEVSPPPLTAAENPLEPVQTEAELSWDGLISDTDPTGVYQKLMGKLDFDTDERNPPDERRRTRFCVGWEDATCREKPYNEGSLAKLTWNNLGYRLGKMFGTRSQDEIHKVYDFFADQYSGGDKEPHSKDLSIEIDGVLVSGSTVPNFYRNVLQMLIDKEFLTDEFLPYSTGAKRHLVALEPNHPSGKDFVRPVKVGKFYVEANVSRAGAIKQLEGLLEALLDDELKEEEEALKTAKPPTQTNLEIQIKGHTISGSTVVEFFQNALQVLADESLAIDNLLPFTTSSKRYLIALESIHPSGKDFFTPVSYGKYFMEANISRARAVDYLHRFLDACKSQT